MRKNRGRVVAAIVALAMLLTAVGGAAVGILSASPAGAHDHLVSSDPAADAELDAPVDVLTLTFSGEVIADGTQVRVTTPTGDADAEVAVDGEIVTATFPPSDEPGEHLVQWRVVSSDGHPVEGEYTYSVAAQAEPGAEPGAEASGSVADGGQDAGAAATPSPSPTAAGTGVDGAGDAMPLVYGAALVALIGAAGVLVARSRRRLHETAPRAPREGPQA